MGAPVGNKYALGNSGGRPRMYESPEDLEKKISEYFDWIQGEYSVVTTQDDPNGTVKCVREPENPSIVLLSLFVGFSSKDTLYEYRKRKEFADCIKRAISIIEAHHEIALGDKHATGHIFALKNMGWRDRQEVKHVVTQESMTEEQLLERAQELKAKLDELDEGS